MSNDIKVVRSFRPEKVEPGTIQRFWLDVVGNGIGQSIQVPIIAARGVEPGPILGVTAVVHGNELNGLSVIQRLFREIDVKQLRGTLVGVPVVNVPSVLNHERRFVDGEDLNRIFPGDPNGDESEVYSHRIVRGIIQRLEYLVDLHTASFGRVNSYYVRANMDHPVTARMAMLQNPNIILNTSGEEGTLRTAAGDLGIHAITVEVGDPNRFQQGMIRSGLTGMYNLLSDLNMLEDDIEDASTPPVICTRSRWLYADRGGILEVAPKVNETVEAGQNIAVIRDVFGEVIKIYSAPESGVVIGRSVRPVNQTGGRIVHLGTIAK